LIAALGAVACFVVVVFGSTPSLPIAANLVGRLVVAVLGSFLVRLATRGRGRSAWVLGLIANGALVLGCVDGSAGAVLDWELAREGDRAQQIYEWSLFGTALRSTFFGEAFNYEEHHYLPFVLNPRSTYHGVHQFDAEYRIRRTEPIRPREAVRWRALAIGGSTTFGERLDREEDTWVHRLERKVRERSGPACDVVNGGVPGYTLNENIIHYTMMLTHLEPDVVILYVGINDVHPRMHTPVVKPDYSNFWKPWHSEGAVLPEPSRALRPLRLYRLWYFYRHVLPLKREGVMILSAHDSVGSLRQNLAGNRPVIYESHLDSFIRLLVAQGRKVLVVPQYFRIDPRTAVADSVFGKGVDDDNVVNRDVAARRGVAFASKALGAFAPADTFDDCHFTPAGSEKMASVVYEALEENGYLPTGPGR
jgi:lysophospholipase L1-like esterase